MHNPTDRTTHTTAFVTPAPTSAGGHPLFRTAEPTKIGTCAHDRRALQQLALNVYVKHSDMT